MPNNEPTIATILRTLAAQYDGPVAERQVLDRVLEQRPSNAKNPYATIRERLRWDGPALGWLRLDRSELVPVRVVLQGLRFRYIPRSWEIEAGLLPLVRLQPFAGLRGPAPLLYDAAGRRLLDPGPMPAALSRRVEFPTSAPSYNLREWYARVEFAPGDSILVTVTATDPLTFQIAHEPAAEFRAADVMGQDAELAAAIFERVYRTQLPLLPCDELVLPIFARAAWRTAYPGRPWQALVAHDVRLQLVEETFVALNQDELTGSMPPELLEQRREREETALLAEIDALQHELSQSRQQDADAGLWTGQIQCASTAYTLLDRRSGHELSLQSDALESLDSDFDLDSLDDWEDEWGEDGLFSDQNEFIDFDELLGQDQTIQDATQRLMAALPPDDAERLRYARPEEAEVIIASHLNDLLVREPSLFVKMDLSPVGSQRDGDTLPDDGPTFELIWDDARSDLDDDWDDDDLEVEFDEAPSVYMRSSELMSQFHESLLAAGKSAATARSRTRNLWVYAEFLAYYYGRTLAEGDYATLDECLFFFYPRKVMNSSARQAREICTSLKQFYSFLHERGDIGDDRFAHALWRRRDQAARVVDLYTRLSSDSPNFEKLFNRLFAPYSL